MFPSWTDLLALLFISHTVQMGYILTIDRSSGRYTKSENADRHGVGLFGRCLAINDSIKNAQIPDPRDLDKQGNWGSSSYLRKDLACLGWV